MTIRIVPTAYGPAFTATLNVLQDRGFVLQEVDPRSGHIGALKRESATVSSMLRSLSIKNHKEMNDGQTYDVSCVVTASDDGSTEVRAMIQKQPPDDDSEAHRTNVYDAGVYRSLFDAIALEANKLAQSGRDSEKDH